jgi:Flp pilus assembly protein TadD
MYKGLPIDSGKVIEKGLALGILENNIKNNELLSNAYIMAKDFDNAVKSLVKITKITDDPKYDYRIGQIQLQNSKFEQAIEYFNVARKKGWNKNPGSLEMLLGVCYIEIEDFTNARIELNKAIDLGKEREANPWLSYIDSTESLRSAALR